MTLILIIELECSQDGPPSQIGLQNPDPIHPTPITSTHPYSIIPAPPFPRNHGHSYSLNRQTRTHVQYENIPLAHKEEVMILKSMT